MYLYLTYLLQKVTTELLKSLYRRPLPPLPSASSYSSRTKKAVEPESFTRELRALSINQIFWWRCLLINVYFLNIALIFIPAFMIF